MGESSAAVLAQPGLEEIRIEAVLQALADPVRLSIVRELAAHPLGKSDGVACGEIPVTISKSTLTHHLRALRDAGVVSVRAEGTRRITRIRTEDLDARFPGLLDAVLGDQRDK